MILIDDVFEDKEASEVTTAIHPPPCSESTVHSEPAGPLLPVTSGYGTFGSNPKGRFGRRKVLRAFLIVWVIWAVVFCLVVGYDFILRNVGTVADEDGSMPSRSRNPAVKIPIDDARIRSPSCVYASPVSSDTYTDEAIIFMNDDRPNRAAAHSSIPVTSDMIHFFNNGSTNRGFGFIRISVSEERRPDIQIDVTISYESEDELNTAQICLVENRPGERGVGIVFPAGELTSEDEKQIRYDFDVILPSPLDETESELFLKRLETNFTLVHHRLDDFIKKVKFETVSLRTSFMPISIAGLFTEKFDALSRDSLFVGSIYATKSVDLRTSNSPISVDISITSNDTQHPSEIILKTSNGSIDASLRFFSNNSDHGGVYLVDAETENAHIGLYNYALPSRSTLAMKARTSRSPITILAPPQFEGTFALSARPSPPFIEPRRVEDPEARGRNRRIYVSSDLNKSRTVKGKVWWDEGQGQLFESQPQLNSSIEVETTLDPVFFKLYHVEG